MAVRKMLCLPATSCREGRPHTSRELTVTFERHQEKVRIGVDGHVHEVALDELVAALAELAAAAPQIAAAHREPTVLREVHVPRSWSA